MESRHEDLKTLLAMGMATGVVVSFGLADPGRSARSARPTSGTPWGHPDLQGTYSNDDETGTPMERPAQFEGRTHESLTTEELKRIVADRNERFVDGVSGDEFAGGPAAARAPDLRHLRAQEQACVAGGGSARRQDSADDRGGAQAAARARAASAPTPTPTARSTAGWTWASTIAASRAASRRR